MQQSSLHTDLGVTNASRSGADLDPFNSVFVYPTTNFLLLRTSVTFDSTSNGQVALVIYEWNDVSYLGVDTPDNSVGGVYRPVRCCIPVLFGL